MSELTGLLLLVAGFGALAATGTLAACCLRLSSPIEFVLGAYVIAWTWLVASALALSPLQLLTRGSLLLASALGLALALGAWLASGRPPPASFRAAMRAAREALRSPAVLVLAIAVSLGAVYSSTLAFLTPANDGDALAYHVARAAFWKQEQGLGYVADAVDLRLDINPPNAEIGQLATMLLSGSDRYVALPQLGAYAALVLCVAALARRIGLTVAEALFAALAFATLPIVAVQASSALNDLVVASFLGAAAVFALRSGGASLVLLVLALGLAAGTKFTAVLALPTLVLIVVLARPRRHWAGLALAGMGGLALGSVWYVVNLVETGELDGGLAESEDQRAALSVPAMIITALRLALDVVDMSGAARPHAVLFLLVACALGAFGLSRIRRSTPQGINLLVAASLTAGVLFAPLLFEVMQEAVFRSWVVLGRPATPPFEFGWNLNVQADPVVSWFGPLGALVLVAGTAVTGLLWRRGRLPAAALAFALAPWAVLLTLAATIVWDPFRGRFLVFGVALAAATWGLFLRSPIISAATAAIGSTALTLSLANYYGKPSGVAEVWAIDNPAPATVRSIWNDPRWAAQTRRRPGTGEESVIRYFEERVPDDARISVAARENDFLSPYFGRGLGRHVSLVKDGQRVPEADEWLVVAPWSEVRRCRDAWQRELVLESGWRVERRVGPDTCLSS